MSFDRVLELLLAALGGGSLTALVSLFRARAQNGLDQAQAWKTLLEQMQSRILHQQIENDDLKIEILEKTGYIEKLTHLLTRASIEVPTYVIRHRTKDKE